MYGTWCIILLRGKKMGQCSGKIRYVVIFIFVALSFSVCLSVCLSICLSLCLSLCLSNFHELPSLLNPFPNKPWFLRVCSTSLWKTLREKEKLLVTSNFSFSRCFLPVSKTFCHFHRTLNCHL